MKMNKVKEVEIRIWWRVIPYENHLITTKFVVIVYPGNLRWTFSFN